MDLLNKAFSFLIIQKSDKSFNSDSKSGKSGKSGNSGNSVSSENNQGAQNLISSKAKFAAAIDTKDG